MLTSSREEEMEYEGYKVRTEGLIGPIYPKRISDLNKMYKSAIGLESFTLEEALRKINGFEMAGITGHSAGILWKRLLIIRGEKEIVVYFPLEFREKTSITIYSKGAREDEIDNLIGDLICFIGEEKLNAEKEGKELDSLVSGLLKKNTVGKIFGFLKKG